MKKIVLLLTMAFIFSWAQSQPEPSSPWVTTGNSGTNPLFNFLGTTDNTPLRFRVRNFPAGEIDTAKAKTFFGVGAGQNITTGYDNTAIGFKSLYSNTIGTQNTACGVYSLYSNIGGRENVAIGKSALYANTYGLNNVAVGNNALRNNTTGLYNVANGWNALLNNTTGGVNVANGYAAMSVNTTGNYNTANGAAALFSNSTGSFNTATGVSSMDFSTNASYNTGNGCYTLLNNSSGYYNTAIGYRAASNYSMGWNNTIIGSNSDVNAAGYYNCVALGESVTCTAPSQARIGNSSTVSIGGYVGWSNFSDGRYKKDVKDGVKGLDFIMKLHPVTYRLDITGLNKKLLAGNKKEADEFTGKAIEEKEKMIFSGFIAQDVEKAAIEIGYDFSGIDKPKNENDLYGLRYAEFVVPLVKSVQELSAQNTALKIELEEIKKNSADQKRINEDLLERLKRLESSFITKNNK